MIDSLSFNRMSEDVVEVRLGDPTDPRTLDLVKRIDLWIRQSSPVWLYNHCYGFGRLSLTFDASTITESRVLQAIETALKEEWIDEKQIPDRFVKILTCYDPRVAPDLNVVAEQLKLSIEGLIAIHSQRDYRVLATGFIPGFSYLGETDYRIQLPRKDVPISRIPAGSVAIAENQTAIYPKETPGGWHLIGRMVGSIVSVTVNSINAKLGMGTTVRFHRIPYDQFIRLEGLNATN